MRTIWLIVRTQLVLKSLRLTISERAMIPTSLIWDRTNLVKDLCYLIPFTREARKNSILIFSFNNSRNPRKVSFKLKSRWRGNSNFWNTRKSRLKSKRSSSTIWMKAQVIQIIKSLVWSKKETSQVKKRKWNLKEKSYWNKSWMECANSYRPCSNKSRNFRVSWIKSKRVNLNENNSKTLIVWSLFLWSSICLVKSRIYRSSRFRCERN